MLESLSLRGCHVGIADIISRAPRLRSLQVCEPRLPRHSTTFSDTGALHHDRGATIGRLGTAWRYRHRGPFVEDLYRDHCSTGESPCGSSGAEEVHLECRHGLDQFEHHSLSAYNGVFVMSVRRQKHNDDSQGMAIDPLRSEDEKYARVLSLTLWIIRGGARI